MANIVSDNPRAGEAIARLCDLVIAEGGFVHEALTFRCEKDQLSAQCDPSVPNGTPLIALPRSCLIDTAQVKWRLAGDDLVARVASQDERGPSDAIVQALTALYNATGKITAHRNHSTLLVAQKLPTQFARLARGRNLRRFSLLSSMAGMEKDDFCVETFLKTRVLRFFTQKAPDSGGSENSDSLASTALMPLIEIFDHHPNARAYRLPDMPLVGPLDDPRFQDQLRVAKWSPEESPTSCYANYNLLDAYDSCLHFNFVETNAPFVRSIPLEIEITDTCLLTVDSVMPRLFPKAALPDELKPIRFFVPRINKDSDNRRIHLSHIAIPGRDAPLALRQVLSVALAQVDWVPQGRLSLEVLATVESRIINANLAFYRALLKDCDHEAMALLPTAVLANVKKMAEVQLEKIALYPPLANGLLFAQN